MKITKKSGTAGIFREKLNSKRARQFIGVVNRPVFGKLFVLVSLLILLGTTIFWSLLGAHLNAGNADQLVNSYLFEKSTTFHNALLPGAHSFLIKWPLFFLIKTFGFSGSAFTIITVGAVLTTVAALALIIYLIERRRLVFGTICLALASVLLLVPAAPRAGVILPVNMAMLATRNLEYVIYIASLGLLIRYRGIRKKEFYLAVALLSLLMASDRLFFNLSLGGALLALFVYALRKGWNLVSLSVNWLLASILAAIGAIFILWILSFSGITHIASLSGAGPYGLVDSFHDLILGILYGGLGILTNFGANPAFDSTIVRDIPHTAISRMLGVGGLSFLVNLLILLTGLVAAWQLLRTSVAYNANKNVELDGTAKLSIWLTFTSIAAVLVFIFSNHYYAVDARYLTIALFAFFIALATHSRWLNFKGEMIVIAALVIMVSITLGSIASLRAYRDDQAALKPLQARNALIAQVLKQHPIHVLVGDYWRVIPTRQLAGNKELNVMPLADCFTPREGLSSKAWQADLQNSSFAYLLSLDRSHTDYPNCKLDQVIAAYGRPNSSVLIAGSLSSPKEILLFYDRGSHKSAPKFLLRNPSTILPVSLDELPHTTCTVPTILNFVAHQDDDLLFMSPDLLHDVQTGRCVRTVYVTAGDAGGGHFHWLRRQQGSEAAYSKMLKADDIWVDRIVKLNDHEFITVSNPRGNSRISLIFMHLPDGNVKGQGFAATNFESLAELEAGENGLMNSVDGQSTYNSDDLVTALTSLMHTYQPSEIRTQANFIGSRYPDHSDHMAVGRYVKRAYQQYEIQQFDNKVVIPISFYIGYPIHELPENVADGDLQEKKLTFYEYAKFDRGVCGSNIECSHNPAYNAYLSREYTNPY